MAFNLKIVVTGICSFVTDKPLRESSRLSLVLLDAWHTKKNSEYKSIDGKTDLPRHGAMLQIPSGNIVGLAGGGRLIWYPKRHQVTFNLTEQTSGQNVYKVEPAVLSHVADMTRIVDEEFWKVDADVLGLRPPKEVLANVLFKNRDGQPLGGTLSVEDGPFDWIFPATLKNSPTAFEVNKMAYEICFDFKDLTDMEIKATPFTNAHEPRHGNPGEKAGASFKIVGSNETVKIIIANACDDNPLIWQADNTAAPPENDIDFKWHYEIIAGRKQEIRNRLNNRELPYPQLLPQLGNGRNCFPAFWIE